MGMYVRRSVKAGPFRFNMSSAGLGVSTGVPGFRVGSGPRGNYVHMGRHGVYYRASLGGRPSSPKAGDAQHSVQPGQAPHPPQSIAFTSTAGAPVLELAPTGPDDLVTQLNAAASKRGWGWPVTIAAVLIGAATMPAGLILWLFAVPLCVWLFLRDRARRTVVLFYDVNDTHGSWYEGLVAAWDGLTRSQKLWRTMESGNVRTVYQHKTNAGASSLVKREEATASLEAPKHLATNVAVPSITSGRSALHLLPDRILIRDGKRYTDVDYTLVRIRSGSSRFIESPGSAPRDGVQVGQTWKYVNVKGGPDRRFRDNPVLPVMLYGDLDIRSANGLEWQIQISRPDAAGPAAQLLHDRPRPLR